MLLCVPLAFISVASTLNFASSLDAFDATVTILSEEDGRWDIVLFFCSWPRDEFQYMVDTSHRLRMRGSSSYWLLCMNIAANGIVIWSGLMLWKYQQNEVPHPYKICNDEKTLSPSLYTEARCTVLLHKCSFKIRRMYICVVQPYNMKLPRVWNLCVFKTNKNSL